MTVSVTTMPSQWTVGTALRRGASLLAAAAVADARLDAELLLADQLGRRRLDLYCHPDDELTPSMMARFAEAIRRRAAGEPLQYVRGWVEFDDLRIDVAPGVLIPRPETELLVRQAAAHLSAAATSRPRFVDVGTGSGCVAIALARAVGAAAGLAVDCSAQALAVARRNLARHGLGARVQLLRGDLCEAVARRADQSIDLIVANLPYVPTAAIGALEAHVRDWEPRIALDGGPDGLALIERLLRAAGSLLSPRGRLMLEIGAAQSPRVAAMARAYGWAVQSIVADIAGIDRVMVLSWIKS